jgi:hypothetical protein
MSSKIGNGARIPQRPIVVYTTSETPSPNFAECGGGLTYAVGEDYEWSSSSKEFRDRG